MKKTIKDLEKELESTRGLLQRYRDESDSHKSQINNLERVNDQMQRDLRDRENALRRADDFKYNIVRILAGSSKPNSKVEVMEDLIPMDVHFMRVEIENRKNHGPVRAVPEFRL